MGKVYLFLIACLAFLVFWGSLSAVSAQGMMGHTAQGGQMNLNAAIQDILDTQNITNIKNVDCLKVASNQFESLGDGFMDDRLGGGTTHEQMDNMMGREGSEGLTTMHIRMGKNYLGCNSANTNYAYPYNNERWNVWRL